MNPLAVLALLGWLFEQLTGANERVAALKAELGAANKRVAQLEADVATAKEQLVGYTTSG